MTGEISQVLRQLVGLPLTGSRRAGDMEMYWFGQPIELFGRTAARQSGFSRRVQPQRIPRSRRDEPLEAHFEVLDRPHRLVVGL